MVTSAGTDHLKQRKNNWSLASFCNVLQLAIYFWTWSKNINLGSKGLHQTIRPHLEHHPRNFISSGKEHCHTADSSWWMLVTSNFSFRILAWNGWLHQSCYGRKTKRKTWSLQNTPSTESRDEIREKMLCLAAPYLESDPGGLWSPSGQALPLREKPNLAPENWRAQKLWPAMIQWEPVGNRWKSLLWGIKNMTSARF